VYEDLKELARLQIQKADEELVGTKVNGLRAAEADAARRGMGVDDGVVWGQKFVVVKTYLQAVGDLIARVWSDLIVQQEGRFTAEDCEFVTGLVHERVVAMANAIKKNADMDGFHRYAAPIVVEAAETTVARVRRDLNIKVEESKLRAAIAVESTASSEVFVIMAANPALDPLYMKSIEPAIEAHDLDAYLMTDREPSREIGSEILSRIASCRLVVADLTFERPNCYYEVGYADALGKKVVMLARRDHDPRRAGRQPDDPKVHFDLDQQKFTFWTEDDWGRVRAELEDRIGQALAQLRSKAD
jgi:hypothetical protein